MVHFTKVLRHSQNLAGLNDAPFIIDVRTAIIKLIVELIIAGQ